MAKKSGILMHISSLPSPYGIGCFGKDAYRFIDFLCEAEQAYWQVLPLSITGFGDSPYQSFSAFAGNPFFIDLRALTDEKLLTLNEARAVDWGNGKKSVDFQKVYSGRSRILRAAFDRFDANNAEFTAFCENERHWLDDFSLFMALKEEHSGKPFFEWEERYMLREPDALNGFRAQNADRIDYWRFVQYKFFEQWQRLKEYANSRGIRIIGDLPLYVACDSVEVWARPELFMLDADRRPALVAGVPPDAFSDSGQLWGNPVYDWSGHRRENYSWWKSRIAMSKRMFDALRLDHFRGFESFYAIKRGEKNAVGGAWLPGLGAELFDALENELEGLEIIAENLGIITDEVRELHEKTGFMGMNVLQFGFKAGGADNPNMPHNISENTAVYAGTHDNDTILAWYKSLSAADRGFCLEYMRLKSPRGFLWAFIGLTLSVRAEIAIITMQDYLGLNKNARMNAPSTVSGNWRWRAKPGVFSRGLAKKIAKITIFYGRGRSEK